MTFFTTKKPTEFRVRSARAGETRGFPRLQKHQEGSRVE